jgi:hypothetical protein
MDKIYERLHWNTSSCNGAMDANQYLYSQTARAIGDAAYEKPLTVEEISMKTGLPALYIEDELPRLIGGDAIVQDGKKYAANFIILRHTDRKAMETYFMPTVADIAGYFSGLFRQNAAEVLELGFYGAHFPMKRLGYIALPAVLREKIKEVKNNLGLENGPFPPRLDGGYGWFIVSENAEGDNLDDTASGCNITDGKKDNIYYFNIGRYFYNDIYHNGGMRWMYAENIVKQAENGVIPAGILTEDDQIRLLKRNLFIKEGDALKLNFAVFDTDQYRRFISLFRRPDEKLDSLLTALIQAIHKSFKSFVPKRLDSQINQWVSVYSHSLISFITEALIERGALEKPNADKPLVNGVFCVLGDYVAA